MLSENRMTYRYPLPPSANRYWRHYRGRTVVSDEARQYKQTLAMLAKVDQVQLLTGPVAVTMRVFRARRAGDLDNRLKVLLDAMQNVFYENDSQVVEIHASLHDDKHDPRVEVSVQSLRITE